MLDVFKKPRSRSSRGGQRTPPPSTSARETQPITGAKEGGKEGRREGGKEGRREGGELPVSQAYNQQFQRGRLEQKILVVFAQVAKTGDLLGPDADDVETRRQQGEQLTHTFHALHLFAAAVPARNWR